MNIFAHRGVSSKFPENTMRAFQEAVKVGADGIEFDVQLSKDDVPVVIHDYTLERTTSGIGFVRDHTCNELKKLSAGEWFHPNYGSEKIPTLEELFIWSKDHSLLLNIELKGYIWDREVILSTVIPLIVKYDVGSKVILSSFDHCLIHNIQQVVPMIETAVLVEAALYDPAFYLDSFCTKGYHFRSAQLLEREAKDLIQKGYRLRPYTVNDSEWMNTYRDWGCAAIITDYPEEARTNLQNIK